MLGKANTIFIEAFDVYGKVSLHEDFLISPGGSYQGDGCEIVDAVQTSNGNYLLLVRQYLVGYSDENSFYYILSADKDGNEKSVLNLSAFAQSNSFENVWFYGNDCKGALCPIDDNKCGIFGSVWNSSGEMYYLRISLLKRRASKIIGQALKVVISHNVSINHSRPAGMMKHLLLSTSQATTIFQATILIRSIKA